MHIINKIGVQKMFGRCVKIHRFSQKQLRGKLLQLYQILKNPCIKIPVVGVFPGCNKSWKGRSLQNMNVCCCRL